MASGSGKEKLRLYDALLSSPGMGEPVKLGFSMTRKDILLLSRVVETGLNAGLADPDSMISLIPKESRDNFSTVMEDLLKRAGLSDFNEKLKQL